MKRKSYIKIISAIIAVLLVLCSCKGNEKAEEDAGKAFSYGDINYIGMVDRIYDEISVDSLTMVSVTRVADETVLSEQYYLNLDNINGFEVRAAEGKFGVADVAVIWVKEGCGDDVIQSLESRKDDRIAEFVDYNVYDSYETAVEADIYQEGDLVIMLILNQDDKAIAKQIIESYISESES